MAKIAIFGYGTVGSGVFDVITKNNRHINRKAGDDIEIKYVLDLREFPGDPVESVLVHDVDIIINDPEVSVAVEVMGGVNPAYTFVKRALLAGKSVCTSNKELVAKYGAELLQIAEEQNVNFLFEASVGGGIPLIRPILESLTADHFCEITGILNGTTNFILTKMEKEGLAFDDVLREAQEKGYAERNPEADIEGYDACRKIAILASITYEKQIDFEDIYTEGITAITEKDFEYAHKMNASIKLLGTARCEDGKIYAMVSPFVIGKDDPLGTVDGVFNAVKLDGDMLGNIMFYGKGAGKHATASAVVSDVVDAVRNAGRNKKVIWDPEKTTLGNMDTFKCKFMVRIEGAVAAEELEKKLGAVELLSDGAEETAFITNEMTEAALMEGIGAYKLISRIRISK